MRPTSVRLALIVLILAAAFSMTAAASPIPAARDQTATPTPAPARPGETGGPRRPTVIEPNRIYEGNYTGDPVEFLLNAELGQFFVLDVTTTAFDAVIEINDDSGAQVARDDDGGPSNMPQLIFTAPSTGQFTVVVRGYSDPVEGGYILRVTNAIEPLAYGVPLTVTMDGTASTIYSFEAKRGDVVNLGASSSDTIDTTLRLLRPDGSELAYVDDFSGIDPEFRRLPLGETGRYFAIHAPYSESAVGDVTLLLEKTELSNLGPSPTAIEMNESSMKDVYNMEVREGILYLVTLTTSVATSGSLDVTDIDMVSYGSVSFNSVEGASLFFRAGFTGTARLTFSVSVVSEGPPIDIYASIRVAE